MSDATCNPRLTTYEAPEKMPTGYRCRLLRFPDDRRVSAAVADVLTYLSRPGTFEDTANVKDADMQAFMAEMFYWFGEIDLEVDMIGAVIPMFADILPDHLLWCEGQTLNRVDYPDLYARVPSAFRVDADTFTLPDMRERFAFGASAGYEIGYTGGEATHVLTEAEMPSHYHLYSPLVSSNIDIEAPGAPDLLAAGIVPLVQGSTGTAGGNQAHNNIPPFIALRWAIVAKRACL